MPRLVSFPLLLVALMSTAAVAADQTKLYEARTFEQGEQKLLYRLLKPKDYDPEKKYPLVLFLHGAGERGDDNTRQLIHGTASFCTDENREKYPCFVVAPQCPSGQRWVEVDWGAASHSQPDKPSEPMRLTLDLLESLQKEFSIDSDRIYVTGLSMGGYGTWDAIGRKPEYFAAAAPICGGGDPAQADKFAHLPIWVFHGDQDQAVKVERSRQMVKALQEAGSEVKYTEYPGVGHDSWTRTYQDPKFFEWLFAQKKSG